MNKKGASFTLWSEIIVFIAILIVGLAMIGVSLNSQYGSDMDLTLGVDSGGAISQLTGVQDSLESGISEGEADFSAGQDFTISTIWSMVKAIPGAFWAFFTGGIIQNAANAITPGGLPPIVPAGIMLLVLLSIGFIVIALILRVIRV